MNLREIAEATPDSRDRYVDFLRAFSILTVVLGHWFVTIIWWHHGLIWTANAIGMASGMWLATWFLQVMPVFFFVGGFSNLVTLRSYRHKGLSTWEFFKTRELRLLRPSLIFVGVWVVVQVALHLTNTGAGAGFQIGHTWFLRGMKPPGATVPFGPLWFLGVYMVVILLAPTTIWLHERFGVWVPVAMTLCAVAVDAVGFIGGHPSVRYLNVVFVLLLPHQLGYFYADGRLGKSLRTSAIMAACGLAALVLLTNPLIFGGHGPQWFQGMSSYPKSLLGVDLEPIANTYPPTLVFVAVSYWTIGLALLLHGPLTRWLRRIRVWMLTIYVNSIIMTLFLWHMTAFLLAILLLWQFGLGREHTTSLSWWLQRPLWELVPLAILAGLVAVFGRFERGPLLRDRSATRAAATSRQAPRSVPSA